MARLRHPRRLPVLLCGAIIGSLAVAGIVISSAGAANNADVPCDFSQFNHKNPAMKLEGNLVPAFKKVSATGATLQHNTPLAQKGKHPLFPSTTFRAINGVSSWCFSITYQKNQPNACVAGIPPFASDVCLDVVMKGVFNPDGSVNNQPLQVVATIRFTDNKFCTPSPCNGPFTESGTGTELDFGPLPVTCSGTLPANTCAFHASANAAIPGSVKNGFKASVQIFRVRVVKAGTVVGQQGISWP